MTEIKNTRELIGQAATTTEEPTQTEVIARNKSKNATKKRKRPTWLVAIEVIVSISLFSGAIYILLYQKGFIYYVGGEVSIASTDSGLERAIETVDASGVKSFIKKMIKGSLDDRTQMGMEIGGIGYRTNLNKEGIQLLADCLADALPSKGIIPSDMEDVYYNAMRLLVQYKDESVAKAYCEMVLHTPKYVRPATYMDARIWRQIIMGVLQRSNSTQTPPQKLLDIVERLCDVMMAADTTKVSSTQVSSCLGIVMTLYVAFDDRERALRLVKQFNNYMDKQSATKKAMSAFVFGLDGTFQVADLTSQKINLFVEVIDSISPRLEQSDLQQITKWRWKIDATHRVILYKQLSSTGEVARLVAQSLLPVTQGEPITDVVTSYLELIQYDMEKNRPSGAFDQMIQILSDRKMSIQAREFAGFFWKTFPQSSLGKQAFWAWVRLDTSPTHRGDVVAAVQDQRAWWDGCTMTEGVKAAQIWLDMTSGQTLQAVVRIVAIDTGKTVNPQVMLTDELVMQWLAVAQNWCARYEYEISPQLLHFQVAEQIQRLNESGLAGVLFWRLCDQTNSAPQNPMTDQTYKSSFVVSKTDDPAMSEYFRAHAMSIMGNTDGAKKVLESMTITYSESIFAKIAHLEFAEMALKTKHLDQASERIQLVGGDLADTARVKRVMKVISPKPTKVAG